MKLIQRLSLLASIALVAIACDIQQTFDERIDDKQLLVLAPDFADTSVQLVFRDPETLAVADQDFEVIINANKRLIDANGNYKNEFIARGGVMEFFVSPEEMVTAGDPLIFYVDAISEDSKNGVFSFKKSIESEGLSLSTLFLEPNLIIDENQTFDSQGHISKSKTDDINLTLLFNGTESFGGKRRDIFLNYNPFNHIVLYPNYADSPNPRYYPSIGSTTIYWTNLFIGQKYWNSHPAEIINTREEEGIKEPLKIDIVGGPEYAHYFLRIGYYMSDDRTITHRITDEGEVTTENISIDSYTRRTISEEKYNIQNAHSFTIQEGVYPAYVSLSYRPKEGYFTCKNGFNLIFDGLGITDETSLMYKVTRSNDKTISAVASFKVDPTRNKYNSLEDGGVQQRHFMSTEANTLEFAENDQYFIEPQIIELGGEELCGSTYTVTLKPRETHKKHNLNLSMRSEDQSVGVALTFSALLRKQGQDDTKWQTIQFKQGSTSVYLEEGSTYEVKLTLADEPFEFTFTNDLSLVDAAVQATKRNVSRIKDIRYSISQTENENTIDAEIVFYDGQSLVD